MMKKLLKQIALAITIITSCSISAQESYDFTGSQDNNFTIVQASATPSAGGLVITPTGNFFIEARKNAVTATGQNRVTVTYINNTIADRILLKVSGTTVQEGAVDLPAATGSSQSFSYITSDPLFTGDIQLRTRFLNSTNTNLSTSDTITLISLVVDSDPTASVNDVFSRANTRIISKEGSIVVKNAPAGMTMQIYNVVGQSVENKNLSSGTYIVKLSAQGAISSKKIMIF